jgi:hypothetical protein
MNDTIISSEHQLIAMPIVSAPEPMFDRTTGYIIAGLVILAVAGYTLDKVMWVLYRK